MQEEKVGEMQEDLLITYRGVKEDGPYSQGAMAQWANALGFPMNQQTLSRFEKGQGVSPKTLFTIKRFLTTIKDRDSQPPGW